jgi:hypothetical protein
MPNAWAASASATSSRSAGASLGSAACRSFAILADGSDRALDLMRGQLRTAEPGHAELV